MVVVPRWPPLASFMHNGCTIQWPVLFRSVCRLRFCLLAKYSIEQPFLVWCCVHPRKKVLVYIVHLWNDLFQLFVSATTEPDDDDQVTRAKYFIRDEFLVSASCLINCYLLVFLQVNYVKRSSFEFSNSFETFLIPFQIWKTLCKSLEGICNVPNLTNVP